MKIIKKEDWIKQAEEMFGGNIKQWQFVCANCGEVQTYQEFINNGIEDADTKFFFSCIGRWVDGRGCDWTLGGLFHIHRTEVLTEDGNKTPVFEFNTLLK